MRSKNSPGGRYFLMGAAASFTGTTILIIIHLQHYIRRGVSMLLPVILCVIVIGISIPILRYIRRTEKSDVDGSYFKAANAFIVLCIATFALIRLPEYLRAGHSKAAILISISLFALILISILINRIKSAAPRAFYIPTAIFICYTLGTIIIGGTGYYFLAYLVICGCGAVYSNYRYFRNFFILSHGLIALLILLGLPLTGPEIPFKDLVAYWIITAFTTIFFLMLCRFSTEKSNRAVNALNTFDFLMAATPNLMVTTDKMNRVTYISAALAALAHIEDYEMAVGRPVLDLFPDIEMKFIIGEILEASGFYDKTVEFLINGEKRYFKIISDQFPGETQGRFIDMSDITPIMTARFEAEDAKARAEEANSAKSVFLAKMSHEIRTPMNAIIGMSELILREQASPVVHEHAAAVKQAGNNLVAIINDILDFSKIESGKLEIIPMEYEFASLINDVITIIRVRLRERSILFVANIDSTIPKKLYGDVIRLRQILLNLLSNAVKYTHEGHIIFTAAGRQNETGSVILTFEIVDSGIGIKSDDMEKLFGYFSQVDTRKYRFVEGSGLGLAIARSLCRTMWGDITVQSAYGEGSTFTALLPQGIRDPHPFAEVRDRESKNVLIYEMRELYARSIVQSLDSLHVSCRLAMNREALNAALDEDRFTSIFAADSLIDDIKAEMEKRDLTTQVVLLVEAGETAALGQMHFIPIPAHTGIIAAVLNGDGEIRVYNEEDYAHTHTRFTAPSARVLVVDDIRTNLKVAEGLLAPYNMRIDTCLSGAGAIRLVRENQYDLVLMDHMMPEMDGIEATRVIRYLPGDYFKKLPIVVLTANAIAGMRDKFLEAGFNDYISKPIEIIKLEEIVSRWIPRDKKIKEQGGAEYRAAAGTSAENTGGALPPIPGVDSAKGITMTGGTELGYRKVLSQFAKDLEERLPIFAASPDTADLALFATHAHALKSAAGTIGAGELSGDAARLEAAGKIGDLRTIRELLPRFYTRLSAVAQDIEAALAVREQETAPVKKKDEAAAGAFISKLEALKTALELKKVNEIDALLDEMDRMAEDGNIRDTLSRISDQVLMSDYGEALEAADSLLQVISNK
jgi:signal transduction histidine kinase/CheY-like chemotaxis protein/HPt (histidine-containing phosphotransfer) domain-containing protein